MAKVNAALRGSASAVQGDTLAQETLRQIDGRSFSPNYGEPTISTAATPSTAGAGGGTPCAASCN